MDFRQLMPSFDDGVNIDEIALRRSDRGGYVLTCHLTPADTPAPLEAAEPKPAAKQRKPSHMKGKPRVLGQLKPDKSLRNVPEARKKAVEDFIRERGTVTGVDVREKFGWDSSVQSRVLRALRVEERVRLLSIEGHTLRYAVMDGPATEGTFRAATETSPNGVTHVV
jgi:hypothetical protein